MDYGEREKVIEERQLLQIFITKNMIKIEKLNNSYI